MALNTNALTTVATIEGDLGISDPGTFERLINVVSAFVASYCDREFHFQSGKVENLIGTGGQYLHTALRPIVELTSISFDGDALTVTVPPDSDDDAEVHNASAGIIYIKSGANHSGQRSGGILSANLPGTERKLYKVTFDGGYVTPPQGGTITLPSDLEDAVVMMVAWRHRNAGRDLGIQSEKVLSETQSRFALNVEGEILKTQVPMAYQILQKYRSWSV